MAAAGSGDWEGCVGQATHPLKPFSLTFLDDDPQTDAFGAGDQAGSEETTRMTVPAFGCYLASVQTGGEALPEWVKIMPIGQIHPRSGRGPFRVRDREAAERIVAASLARAGQTDLVIDYDHQSDLAAVPGVGGTAPASGWMTALEARDDGIYARVKWTAAAEQKLRSGEYRYLSPTFYADKRTGDVSLILRAGLTNSPEFDLVAASERGSQQGEDRMNEFLKQLAAILAMAEDSSEEDVLAAVKSLAEQRAVQAKELEEVAASAGLSRDDARSVTKVVAAVKATVDPARFVPADQVLQLQSQLASLQAGIAEQAAQAAVDAAVKAGKVIPALRDWAVQLHRSDPAAFDKYVAAAPVLVDGGTRLAGPPDATGSSLTPEEKQVCSALGLTEEAYLAQRKEIGR